MNERKQNDRKERAYIKRMENETHKKLIFLLTFCFGGLCTRPMMMKKENNKKKMFVCSFEGNLWTRGTFES